MAIRAGLTVYDLEEQELAYAPPFGSAKDPINMAGFVASNVLRGDLTLWYSQDFPDEARGRAPRGRAHHRGVRHLAPAGRRKRSARHVPRGHQGLGPRRSPCACTAPSASAPTWPTASSCRTASPTSPRCPADRPPSSTCTTPTRPSTRPCLRWRTTPRQIVDLGLPVTATRHAHPSSTAPAWPAPAPS